MSAMEAAIAVNRFGLGARPGELAQVGRDPQGWLKAQVARADTFTVTGANLPDSATAYVRYEQFRQAQRTQARARQQAEERGEEAMAATAQQIGMGRGELLGADLIARTQKALRTEAGFSERLALFWANHFTAAATKGASAPYIGPFEREAIRANMTGRFGDLLLAATRHPGMLAYLDQAQSIGPNSPAGQRGDRGLNENLAREILELHTLGVRSGYTQADVIEFAKALTGWTIANPRLQRLLRAEQTKPGTFTFAQALHEPGARTVLGKRYPEAGAAQAEAILADLAVHPATAKHVATKLARHFIADEPPASAVTRLEKTFLDTGGSLPALHRALVDLPEAWAPQPAKFKTPNDFIVSTLRMLDAPMSDPRALVYAYEALGQGPFRAPSPAGWPDEAQAWAGPDALMKRIEWSQALAQRLPGRARPEELLAAALGPGLTEPTRTAIRRAESGAQGLVLGLMSSEFQRR